MVHSKPLLADAQAIRYIYQPGDRLLVRVSVDLSPDQKFKILRAIRKRTGEDLRILTVNCHYVEMLWQKSGSAEVFSLVSKKDIELQGIDAGVANLDCSVTQLGAGDTIIVRDCRLVEDSDKKLFRRWVQEWTGPDVEVIVQ